MPVAKSFDWVSGEFDHIPALNRFVCTDPPKAEYDSFRKRPHHPRKWELEAQSAVRNANPPANPGEMWLLAIGAQVEDVAAACYFGFDRSYSHFMIWVVATAMAYQKQGLGLEAVTRALAIMADTKARYAENFVVHTRIHPKNAPSLALFQKAGFELQTKRDREHEMWVKVA